MDQYLDTAYEVTTQLFGADSGIPWWAWSFVLLALFWKVLVPEPKTAEYRDTMMLSELFGGDDEKKKSKKK